MWQRSAILSRLHAVLAKYGGLLAESCKRVQSLPLSHHQLKAWQNGSVHVRAEIKKVWLIGVKARGAFSILAVSPSHSSTLLLAITPKISQKICQQVPKFIKNK